MHHPSPHISIERLKSSIGTEFYISILAVFISTAIVRVFGGLTDNQLTYTLLLLLPSLASFAIPVTHFFMHESTTSGRVERILRTKAKVVLSISRVYPVSVVILNLIRILPTPALSSFDTYFMLMGFLQTLFSVWQSYIIQEWFKG